MNRHVASAQIKHGMITHIFSSKNCISTTFFKAGIALEHCIQGYVLQTSLLLNLKP